MSKKLQLVGAIKLPVMTGADVENDGTSGAVPAPTVGDESKFLRGDGTWAETVGSIVETDDTLTKEGHAADAKITGDKISAIEATIADILYEPITITSFSNNVGTVEMGTTVTDVTLSWELNKEATSLTLDGVEQSTAASGDTALTRLGITANTSWTLTATDERNATATKSTGLTFLNGVYYGVAADASIDSAFVQALTKKLQGSKSITFTVSAGEGEYIYFALPTSYGAPTFNVGGFDGGFSKVAEFEYTNIKNYTQSYAVWKSDNANLGDTTVTVK